MTADQALIDAVLPDLVKLVGDGDARAVREYFKADPKGIRLYLEKGIMPKTFAGRRFVAMLPTLLGMVDTIYAAEKMLVDNFLEGSMTAAEAQALRVRSLFMSPRFTATVLAEWVNKPWKGHSLSQRIWDFSKTTEDTLLKLVASGIAEGKGPTALKPIIKKVFTDQSDYVVRRLLLTESSRISHDVQRIAVSEFKHIKYVVLKYGVRHKKDCACTPWKNKGKMLYEDAPSMPIHPNSSSYLQPVSG
ncbi:hypothetical protein [Deinococcus ficus]|uniref:hypothetical protein n=1 Tax=Deinococcus ficus TaxID=317577 RepID=UPI00131C7DAA|nr:hypothetical protein [Deinococcus ficus]